MKKGTSVFQNLRLLKNCATYDVHPAWNLLIGFPGEREEVYKKYLRDIPLLTHLPPPSGVYPVRFDRYSPYFTKAQEYGLDLSPVDYYGLIYPFSTESLMNLAYYFTDRNFGADYIKGATKWIGELRAKVGQWQAIWSQNRIVSPSSFSRRTDIPPSSTTHGPGKQLSTMLASGAGRYSHTSMISLRNWVDLAKKMAHVSGFDPAREVAALQAKGLVFEEGERYLNLVLAKEPPKMTQGL